MSGQAGERGRIRRDFAKPPKTGVKRSKFESQNGDEKDNPAWLKAVTLYRVTQTKEARAWTKGTKARFALTVETVGILRKAGRQGIDMG